MLQLVVTARAPWCPRRRDDGAPCATQEALKINANQMGLLSSLLGAFFASMGLAVSTAASIYWTSAPLSNSVYAGAVPQLQFRASICPVHS